MLFRTISKKNLSAVIVTDFVRRCAAAKRNLRLAAEPPVTSGVVTPGGAVTSTSLMTPISSYFSLWKRLVAQSRSRGPRGRRRSRRPLCVWRGDTGVRRQ